MAALGRDTLRISGGTGHANAERSKRTIMSRTVDRATPVEPPVLPTAKTTLLPAYSDGAMTLNINQAQKGLAL
jgi:hypothetical protein